MVANFDELIGSFYEAALDDTLWPSVIRNCTRMLGAEGGSVYCLDFDDKSSVLHDHGNSLAEYWGFDAAAMRAYAEHYTYVNVWQANEHLLPEGASVTSSMLFPDAELLNTEFGYDWLRPQNLFYALGGVAQKSESLASKLSFLRPRSAGPYSEREFQLFTSMVGHLNRALRLRKRAAATLASGRDALSALDLVPQGVVLLSAAGRVVHSNRLADKMLRVGSGLFVDAIGTLRCVHPDAERQLQRLIRNAAASTTEAGELTPGGGALRIAGTEGRLHATVLALPARSERIDLGRASAAVFLTDPDAAPPNMADIVRALYGMTAAESRLANAVANGVKLSDFAEQRGLSIHTVRAQLKTAMAKAGVRRQAELVRLLLTESKLPGSD